MKTHYVVLVLLSFILFTNVSCKDDDDNIIIEPEQVEFTSENYIYENDIRLFYFGSENVRLNDSITAWEALTPNDPGYDEAFDNLENAQAEIFINKTDSTSLANNFTVDDFEAGFVIPDFGPFPPPQPCFCFSVRNSFNKLLFYPGTNLTNISFIKDGDPILELNENNPLINVPGIDSGLVYQTINPLGSNIVGEGVLRLSTNGSPPIEIKVYYGND